MNNFFGNEPNRAHYDLMYYWDIFQPIVAAVVVFIIGWILALVIAAGVKNYLVPWAPTIVCPLQLEKRQTSSASSQNLCFGLY